MAMFYSSFFSSGLLATSTLSPTPTLDFFRFDAPSTSRATLREVCETTPAASSPPALPSIVETPPSQAAAHAQRPHTLRRRRSSLSLAATQVAGLKASIQRQIMVNNAGAVGRSRARAGSVIETAKQSKNRFGRMRSGSSGNSLRSRRIPRPKLTPLPPPTAPLPSLPKQPPLSPIQLDFYTPTRPLAKQSQTADSTLMTHLLVPLHTPPLSRALTPNTPFGMDDVTMPPMIPSPLGNRDENGLRPLLSLKSAASTDCLSPIETPGENNIAGYSWRDGPLDEDMMKEN